MKSRILIYDLDAAKSQAISRELTTLAHGDTLAISTARSVAAVRLQTAHQSPNLLLAALTNDSMMLARRIYERTPATKILFLYDPGATAALAEAARQAGWLAVDRSTDSVQLARQAGALIGLCPVESGQTAVTDTQRPAATLGDVQLLLDVLRRQTQAQLVLFTDQLGNLITQRGDAGTLDIVALTSLIAGGFSNSLELGRAMHDPETRHLNLLEGQIYDVYATNAGNDRLLALVFDKRFVEPKLGFVWLLLKRGAAQLSQMHIVEGSLNATLYTELTESMNSEFDRLFGDDLDPDR
ncbi:MAG: hypothetical protein WCP31_07750 [Chloroflexales bacterium]